MFLERIPECITVVLMECIQECMVMVLEIGTECIRQISTIQDITKKQLPIW
ncbi:hypothetical protein D3C72_2511610 [compost metagenome]